MKQPLLIYADFMKSDEKGRLPLICAGTFKDLEKHSITLQEGMKILFYNEDEDDKGNRDDLIVEGIVEFDKDRERWAAKIDWNEIKNISKLSFEEKKKLGFE